MSGEFKLKVHKDFSGNFIEPKGKKIKRLLENFFRKYLGIYKSWDFMVLGYPSQESDGYSYPVKPVREVYHCFSFRIYTKECKSE